MLKSGIINSEIIKELALMGSGDQIIVASSSFPKIEGVKIIDISLVKGLPTIEQVMDGIKDVIDIDMITLSDEVKSENVGFEKYLDEYSNDVKIDYQSYRQIKVVAKNAVVIIRTGDSNLYKTSIVRCEK